MGIVNRRNAFLGWLAWNVAKRVLASKARQVVPSVDSESKRPNRAAAITLLAVLGLGAWLAKNYLDDDGDEGGDDVVV